MSKQRNDYDSLWKEIITHLFEDFLLFFAPDLYEQVDFSKEPAFLEQELRKLFTDAESKKRYTDKLAKVYLKDGKEQWILIHVEVQGNYDGQFAERMFRYFYRVLDKYNRKIYAISVFTDGQTSFKPNEYTYDFFGTQLTYTYNTYKITEQDEQTLIESSNPFALVILAGLYAVKGKELNQRYKFKKKLIHLLLENNWSREHMNQLLIFIDAIIRLPDNESEMFALDVKPLLNKEGENLGLSLDDTSFAKYYRKEGLTEGVEKEREEIARKMLKEGLPPSLIAKVTGLLIEQINGIKNEMSEK